VDAPAGRLELHSQKGQARKPRKSDAEQAKAKAKGVDKVKVPPPVRREPTFLDKLVLSQPPPKDVETAAHYEGASFVRQSAAVEPPKPKAIAAIVKPKQRGTGVKAGIQRMAEAARKRREAAAKVAATGDAAPDQTDGIEITGERSWAEKDAELREAAVDLEESSVPTASGSAVADDGAGVGFHL
jgi:hypothetical protein